MLFFESGNLETLKRLVEQDFGITLMPFLAMENHDVRCANGIIKNFADPIPTRKIRMVYSREFLKNNVINALASIIMSTIPNSLKNQSKKYILD